MAWSRAGSFLTSSWVGFLTSSWVSSDAEFRLVPLP
jgi:hypothetical protein